PAQNVESAAQRVLQHELIDAVSHQSEATFSIIARPRIVDRQYRGRLPRGGARRDDALDCAEIQGVPKLAWNAEKVGEIELTDPQRIDAVDAGDGFDVRKTIVGFDLSDDQRALVQRSNLGGDLSALIVIVSKTKRRAASSLRWVARARHDVPGLGSGPYHRDHDAKRADVERTRDEVVFAARHARHRNDFEPAAQRNL